MSRTALGLSIAATLVVACSPADHEGVPPLPPEIPLEQDLRIDGYEHDLVTIFWLGVAPSGTIAVILDEDRAVFVSSLLKGLSVGIEQVGDGVWSVYFGPVHLGWLDERDYRIMDVKEQNRRRR